MIPRLKNFHEAIHIGSLQNLTIEIYKSINHLKPDYTWEFPVIFALGAPLREFSTIQNRFPNLHCRILLMMI